MNYYKVLAKCGHVGGRRFYIPIEFFTMAESAKSAAKIIRECPRVKHNQKDAILSVESISYEEYNAGKERHYSDPYIKALNPFEQFFHHDEIMARVVEEVEPYTPWANKYKDRDIDAEYRPNLKKAAKFGHNKRMQSRCREDWPAYAS